jgi:23S rRNA (adenine2503-C2)-methyltransferase
VRPLPVLSDLPDLSDLRPPDTASAATHLFGLRPPELAQLLAAHGVLASAAEARRVLGRLLSEGHTTMQGMKKPVARAVREAVAAHTTHHPLAVVERVTDDADGFEKFLLRLDDGRVVEAVKIPLQKPGCFTVCLSSQVGCAMGCAFCATGRLGLTRHLHAWEMVAQWAAVRAALSPGERITGAVFMGQGEPLHNYDAVIQAASVLCDPCGGRIEAKAISISTVGLVPQILRYARERHRFRLVISLHTASQENRERVLPTARTWPLPALADAIRALHQSTGDRVTVAFCLMAGVNDDAKEAEALRALLPDVPLRINLIDVNDARSPEEGGFVPPSDDARHRLFDALSALGHPVVRRYSGGKQRHAACGMLAARELQPPPSPIS